MRQLARLGCAALALLVIAGLTSIGLYSIVAGGLLNNVPVGRSVTGGAPVLVTIQAGSATATPATASGEIPTPGPNNPSKPGPALASPAAAPAPAPGPSGSGAASGGASPASTSASSGVPSSGSGSTGSVVSTGSTGSAVPAAGGPAANPQPAGPDAPSTGRGAAGSNPPSAAPAAQPATNRRVTHEGLAAEIVDVEHGWSPVNIDGTSIGVQAGLDIVTVLLQLTNTSGELRYIGEGDVLLVGSDGSRYAPRPTPLAREPRLLTMPILPGDVVRGWQTYAVPPGVSIARAQWNPSRADRTSGGAAYNLDLPN